MKYVLKLNVIHDNSDLPKGSVCPDQYVKPLLAQGLLLEVEEPKMMAEPELDEVSDKKKKVK